MAVAVDAQSNSGPQDSVSTFNWSHTVSGSNRYLVVGLGYYSNPLATASITWNNGSGNQRLTQIGGFILGAGIYRTALFGLIAPNTGSGTITVTMNNASFQGSVGAVSMTGVDQTTP